ncbi:MAG: hypothetical protein KDA86_00330 [Planctomycetaceae bacterium]|nr:hypothetical protein [Planctomycetaceae bacterium]
MTVTPDQARLQEPAISAEDAKLWRDRWRQAAEMDQQLRAERIQSIDWKRDWPWISGLLNLGVQFSQPRLPVSLIVYRRRLVEWQSR